MKIYRKPPPETIDAPSVPLHVESIVYDDDAGCFTAVVCIDGQSFDVDDCHGVWRITPEHTGDTYNHVATEYAVVLQEAANAIRRKLNMPIAQRSAYGRI